MLTPRRPFTILLVVIAVVAMACVAVVILHGRSRSGTGLPFHDSFSNQSLTGWQTQGGEWVTSDNSVINNSNEIGSRLLTGKETLTDYTMDSDVRLTNSYGDAGVVVRVTQSEEGTNSFFGYYAGLRLPDMLILARMDYGYQPLREVKLPIPVVPGTWYHLSMTVRGCMIAVRASDMSGHTLASTETSDNEECQTHGSFGLRSFAAGGSWRNVRVQHL